MHTIKEAIARLNLACKCIDEINSKGYLKYESSFGQLATQIYHMQMITGNKEFSHMLDKLRHINAEVNAIGLTAKQKGELVELKNKIKEIESSLTST